MTDQPTTKRTYMAFLLDQSGSMNTIRTQAIDLFNEQIGTIKRNADKGGDTWVSLYKFGGGDGTTPHWERAFDLLGPDALVPLTELTYIPNGVTPLYDCVGMALSDLETHDAEGDVGFLFVIISDGFENASKEWRADAIADKVKRLEATGRWTFVYLGANQDLADIQKHLGLRQVAQWYANPSGVMAMNANLVSATEKYMEARSRGETNSENYYVSDDTTGGKN